VHATLCAGTLWSMCHVPQGCCARKAATSCVWELVDLAASPWLGWAPSSLAWRHSRSVHVWSVYCPLCLTDTQDCALLRQPQFTFEVCMPARQQCMDKGLEGSYLTVPMYAPGIGMTALRQSPPSPFNSMCM
jgi:hypothetical protein